MADEQSAERTGGYRWPSRFPRSFVICWTKKAFAHLATVMPDGQPQVTPVWFDADGAYIRINSA